MGYKTVMNALADKNGVFQHFIHYECKAARGECYCDSSIFINRRRTAFVPLTQVLSCPVCEARRQKLQAWSEKVEASEREAQRQAEEETGGM